MNGTDETVPLNKNGSVTGAVLGKAITFSQIKHSREEARELCVK
jgi:hypothetical protein